MSDNIMWEFPKLLHHPNKTAYKFLSIEPTVEGDFYCKTRSYPDPLDPYKFYEHNCYLTEDKINEFYRYHDIRTGRGDFYDKPLILDIVADPLQYRFTFTNEVGEWESEYFNVTHIDVPYDDLESFVNDLYNLDIVGTSAVISQASATGPVVLQAISLREYRENKDLTDKERTGVYRTIDEYKRRIEIFCTDPSLRYHLYTWDCIGGY